MYPYLNETESIILRRRKYVGFWWDPQIRGKSVTAALTIETIDVLASARTQACGWAARSHITVAACRRRRQTRTTRFLGRHSHRDAERRTHLTGMGLSVKARFTGFTQFAYT
jgi:cupin superfamily acireductone dioxygenase involved in methionine salvage